MFMGSLEEQLAENRKELPISKRLFLLVVNVYPKDQSLAESAKETNIKVIVIRQPKR